MRAVTFCEPVVPVCTAVVFSGEDVVQPETRSMQKSPAMRRSVAGFVRMVSDLPCVRYRYFPGGILVLCFETNDTRISEQESIPKKERGFPPPDGGRSAASAGPRWASRKISKIRNEHYICHIVNIVSLSNDRNNIK